MRACCIARGAQLGAQRRPRGVGLGVGGWEVGREVQEGGDMGIYVYLKLIHFIVQQKLTQHCKATILQ